MSDSGFSGLPPRTEISNLSYPLSRAEVKAQIIAIKGEYKAANVRSKMEGEIVANNKDGSTRIQTEKGEITVKFPPNEKPAAGDKVIVEIPAGNAPKQLTVTTKDNTSNTAQPSIQKAPDQTVSQSSKNEAAIKTETSKNAANVPRTETAAIKPNIQTELKAGDLVRFLSITGKEVVSNRNETIISNIQTSFPFTIKPLTQLIQSSSNLFQTILPKNLKSTNESTQINQTSFPKITQQPIILGVEKASQSLNSVLAPSLQALLTPLTTGVLQSTEAFIKSNDVSSTTLSAFKTLDVKISNITQPNIELSNVSGNENKAVQNEKIFTPKIAGEFSGKIIGFDQNNFPVISVNEKTLEQASLFSIQVKATNLTLGSEISFAPQLSLEVSGLPASGSAAALNTTAPLTQILSKFSWPAFDELIQTTQQLSPRAVNHLAQMIPNPASPGKVAPSILFFVAAIRGGDINSWLGEKTINLLRKHGKSNLINRLNADISNLSRISSEPVSQDWRLLSLPLFWQGEISKMQLFYRHDGSKHELGDKDDKQGTRFLFDLTLDKMGPVQLDGFHRPKEAGGRLDLVVRTQKPLSPSMQNAMRLSYINALNQADVQGELLFQGTADKFIKIEVPGEKIEFSA